MELEIPAFKTVSIRPGVGIIGLFPHMNYKPWYALAELVDNALASSIQYRDALREISPDYRCRIDIEISSSDGGQIRVADNAAGIATEAYHNAFVAAEPPMDATGLSQFGVGMKSASCWFARNWRVRTSALGEPIERSITFDVPRIVEEGTEELVVEEVAANPAAHFTELTLWNLYKPPQTRTLAKMEEHLASMYRVFLAQGDVDIRFNGTPLVYAKPTVLTAKPFNDSDAEAVAWSKEIDFSLPTGESIRGFAGIRETASTSKAGFALFRRNRLIVGSSDDSYRPFEIFGAPNRFRYQRVFGELHLDDFDVSHTKDGFIWGESEQAFLDTLREQLDAPPLALLRQAENYRSRTPNDGQRHAGTRALDSTARAVEGTSEQLESQVATEPDGSALPETQELIEEVEQKTLRVWVQSRPWDICIELSYDQAVTDWITISEPSPAGELPRQLGIRIGLAHPFMMQFSGTTTEDMEPLMRVAAGLALAEVTSREAGVQQAGTIRRNLNELLRGSLSRP